MLARWRFTVTFETVYMSRRSRSKRERFWVARAKIAARPVSWLLARTSLRSSE